MRPSAACRCLVLSVSLAGCAADAGLAPLPAYTNAGYRLGGGDQIRIITFGEDQLTGEFRVDDQGKIAVPLLGPIGAAGLTTEQLGSQVGDALRRHGMMHDPSVSVEIIAYRPVYVLGEVAKPGEYPYQPGMTMLTAIAIAGGFTYRAIQNEAADIRVFDHTATEGLITPRSFVAPGDVIKVLERRF